MSHSTHRQGCLRARRAPAEAVANAQQAIDFLAETAHANQRLFIAAEARALDLTLVTNNTAEFERVKGLGIGNWMLPARRKR